MRRLLATTCLILCAVASSAPAATIIHDYELNGTLADSKGGPALVSLGGTIGSNVYTFGAEQGLSLSNALTNNANYSIEMVFEFDTLSGYRKVLDFII